MKPAEYQQYEVVIPTPITRDSLKQLFTEVLGIPEELQMKRTSIESKGDFEVRAEYWLTTVFEDGSQLKIHSIQTEYPGENIEGERHWSVTYGSISVDDLSYEVTKGKWISKRAVL